MSDTPDLDKARAAANNKKIAEDYGLDRGQREFLLDDIVKFAMEQRAEEADRCNKLTGLISQHERAADLRRQAGGGK